MKILAVYNIKGGVGKTSAAVNVAHLAAASGLRVLIWDLDPQAAASYYFRIKPKIKGGGKRMIRGKLTLDDHIKGTDYENLDLLPADFSYRKMDMMLDRVKKPTGQLTRLLRPLAYEFDLVVLDCPPSISLLSENIFRAASALLIPTIPTTLSVRTFEQLLKFLKGEGLGDLELMPFFSMSDRRKKMHLEIMQELPAEYSQFLATTIPYASDVERMGVEREPVTAFGASSVAGRAYQQLWGEVSRRLRLRPY